jgi:hypothetical protein
VTFGQLRSGERKALVIFVVVVVAFVSVVGGTVALLTDGFAGHDEDDHPPKVALAVGGTLTRIEPARWCSVDLSDCSPARMEDMKVPRVPVEVGESVVLSVPASIAERPWNIVAEYLTPHGSARDGGIRTSGSTYTMVLHSRPDYILTTIEIQLPSIRLDADGVPVARAIIAADTRPREKTGTDKAGSDHSD